jgi:phosphate transport system permease protein
MSTNIDSIAKPQRPWLKTPRELMPSILIFVATIAISQAIVMATPLKGKLGYAAVFVPLVTLFEYIYTRRTQGSKAATDVIASSIMFSAAFIVFLPVLSILTTTIVKGVPGLHWTLFTESMFDASYQSPVIEGGLLHAIIGTLFLIFFSLLISVPLGILTALYLTEIRGPGSAFIQFMVQAMSGVPSVIAGLFIYASVILLTPLDVSAFVGSLALTILMLPTVTRTSTEVLKLIPNDLREAGLAMGATQWRTVAMIVVPAARSGLLTATILGVARIAGETAPLIFTLGVIDGTNLNPFSGASSSLPIYIWRGFGLATDEAVQRAWTGILVLLTIILGLFTIARAIGARAKG